MQKIKVKIHKWREKMYSAHADIRKGSLETNNYTTPHNAKKAFIYICNRLGISRDRYEFE